ncbi:amidohydrolase family protein [Consotaella aegiceratis]|uniref:amidohydrolase family protein n=1 Tax=Consotaella aegiceratis TaxID=3097961 RepID=UPI002F4024ED
MATHDLLREALSNGATSVGGCPYTDPEPVRHIDLILDLAERFGVPADFHIDFDLDPLGSHLPALASATKTRGLQGRVSVGHATKLAAMAPEEADRMADLLADAGIAVVVLPATDLFLNGREADRLVPRGVARADRLAARGVRTAIASNNILNPFTPYGDASLIRMANLYANVAQLASDDELALAFDMVTSRAAEVIGMTARLAVGEAADLVVLDAADPASAVREIAPPVAGFKNGRQTFDRPAPRLLGPARPGSSL